MNALCAEMHAHCQIIAQDWDGLIPSLLAANMTPSSQACPSPRASSSSRFFGPYFSNTIVWLAKSDGSFDPNNITNQTLASQRGTTGAAYITEKYDGKDGNRVQLHDTYTNAYLDTKADAIMQSWLKKYRLLTG